MNVIADLLTLSRGFMVVAIFLIGIMQGIRSIPIITILTILCWVTDVLDGKLARKTERVTRMGRFDVVMDLGLALVLAICFTVWGWLPWMVLLAVFVIVLISSQWFRFEAPLKLAMGLIYGALAFIAWQSTIIWGWVIVGSWGFLLLLNPDRFKQLMDNFLKDAERFFRRPENRQGAQDQHKINK